MDTATMNTHDTEMTAAENDDVNISGKSVSTVCQSPTRGGKTDAGNADILSDKVGGGTTTNDVAEVEDSFKDLREPRHKTILGGDATSSASVSLNRCVLQDCCENKVHCPFCDVRQYKPAQPARVRDHLHLTHFQHAVYYDGMMVVKCFHACRDNSTKGGHYHCPVCSTTLLKRNAFTNHLLSHASKQGLDNSAVQAPDAKKPAVIYYDGHKMELCHLQCLNTHEPHFHCLLCQRSCEQLSALTSHLWRCKKRASSLAAKVDSTGYSLNVPKLFSPEMVQCMPHLRDLKEYKWHLSIVRNLSDLPLTRCELSDCCKGRYHCPLCTTAKLKPNHLCHMKQHFVSHWRSGVPFKSYTVLVCYLPCELTEGVDRIRFHYHCPLCGRTRRRRQGFARHLQICDPSKPAVPGAEEEMEEEEEEEDGAEGECGTMGRLPVDGSTFVPLSESDAWPSQQAVLNILQVTTSRHASADQAELQAAESLVDMDHRIQMESLSKNTADHRIQKSVTKNADCQDQRLQMESLSKNAAQYRIHDLITENIDSLDHKIQMDSCSNIADSSEHRYSTESLLKNIDSSDQKIEPHSKNIVSLDQMIRGNSESRSENSVDQNIQMEFLDQNKDCVIHNMEVKSLKETMDSLDSRIQAMYADRSTDSSCSQSQKEIYSEQSQITFGEVLDDTHTSSQIHTLQTTVHESNITSVSKFHGQERSEDTEEISEEQLETQFHVACSELEDNASDLTKIKPCSEFKERNQSDTHCRKSDQSDSSNLADQSDTRQVSVDNEVIFSSANQSNHRTSVDQVAYGSSSCGNKTANVSLKGGKEKMSDDELEHAQSATAVEERKENLETKTADHFQIFQQVTTRISDNIVSELQKQGILQQSLQVIGQLCKVAWQQSNEGVTMTCDLEELCHAQSFFKQILKAGIQNFLNTLPAKASSSSSSSSSNDDSAPPQPSPPKPVRKRGRPKGSKNKATILKVAKEECTHNIKLMKTNEDIPKTFVMDPTYEKDSLKLSTPQSVHGGAEKAVVDRHEHEGDLPPQTNLNNLLKDSSQGGYSGRTRGKRINFARLNAGNMSPSHDADGQESLLDTSPGTQTTPKRSRGRPRKSHPKDLSSADSQRSIPQVEDGRTSELSSQSLHRKPQGLSTQLDDGKAQASSVQCDIHKAAAAEPNLSKNCVNIVAVPEIARQDPSATKKDPGEQKTKLTESRTEVVWVPCTSNMKRRKLKTIVSSASIPVFVTRPKSPIKHFPAAPNLPVSTTVLKSCQADGRNILHPPLEGIQENDKGEAEKASPPKSPTISGKSAGMYRRKRGAIDFAIIPNVIFDFAVDAEEDGDLKQPFQKDNAESSADVTAGEINTSSVLVEGVGRGVSENIGETEIQRNTATMQTDTGAGMLLRCPVCKSVHQTYSLLTQHLSAQHPNKPAVTCDVCRIVCPTPGALTLHLERRHGPKPQQVNPPPCAAFRCASCGKECVSAASLRWHRTLVHKEESGVRQSKARLKCGLCNYTAVDSWDMRHHREQHRNQPATCCVCAKTLSSEAALKVHMAARHSSNTFTCHICDKTFAHMRYLRSHLQRHGGEKRHVCPECGWRFYQTNTLRAHMDTHKPRVQRKYAFRCPHCPAAYNSQANYSDHLNKHTGERPHVCTQCGRGFAFRSMLTTHVAFVHSSDRPHCCSECDKKYKTKAQLQQHLMTHTMARTGKSPFMCSKCGRPMASKSRLRAHAKRCKGGNFFWHQRLAPSGQQPTKVQTVNIVAGQPVNLMDLLPGQRISVVHHGFGKDATITLIPIQKDSAQGTTALSAEEQKSVLLQQDCNSYESLKPEELDKNHICSETMNPSEDMEGSQMGDSQQGVLTACAVSTTDNCMSELRNETQIGASKVIGVFSSSGSAPVLVQNGQTVGLLSSVNIPQIQASQTHPCTQADDASASESQAQNVSDYQPLVSEETFQSETLQAALPSHQLVLSDRLGQTQTLFLPSDLLKQEIVVIESEGGHQNILDLSQVQIVQADSILHQPDVQFMNRNQKDDNVQLAQILPPNNSEGTSVFLPPTESSQVERNHFPVQGGEGGDREASIYICSTCDQQFSSMDLAQQHILLDHTLDPAPPMTASLEEMASASMETQDQVVMDLPDEQIT